jgi:uncharacterized membrane protein
MAVAASHGRQGRARAAILCAGRVRSEGGPGVPDAADDSQASTSVGKARLEAFSDGVFAIAITLLVLDLTIGPSGSALERVLHAWPFYVGYVVSFLTIGAAWLAHTGITDRLTNADSLFLRVNLLLLMVVALLPFPTRLIAEALDDIRGERIFVTMYGLTLLMIRLLLSTLDMYARRQHLYASDAVVDEELEAERETLLPVVIGYTLAITIGFALPRLALVFYFCLALYLVVPFREIARLLSRRRP